MSRYQIERLGPGTGDVLEQLRHSGGRVLARFERTLDLRTPGGRLLALHTAEVGMTPFSARLTVAPPQWPAEGISVSLVGDTLQIEDLCVRLPAESIAGIDSDPMTRTRQTTTRSTLIETEETQCVLEKWAGRSAFGQWWHPELNLPPRPCRSLPRRGEGWGEVRSARTTRREPRALDHVLEAAGTSALRRLVDALRLTDFAAANRAARALLGLGPGLTPSGDDALVGLFGAWMRLAPRALPLLLARQLTEEIAAAAPSATTAVSAEFLRQVADGWVSEAVDELIAALGSGDRFRMERAAARLATWGHSSGQDCIAGILALTFAARDAAPPWRTVIDDCVAALPAGPRISVLVESYP